MIKKIHRYLRQLIRYSIILALVIAQTALVIFLAYYVRQRSLYIYILIEVISLMIFLPMISDNRNASYKLYWLTVALLFPVTGQVMYVLWGMRRVNRKEHARIQSHIDAACKKQIFRPEYVEEIGKESRCAWKISNFLYRQGYPVYTASGLEFFSLGENAFKDMLQEMEKAEKFIFMSFFTIRDGKVLSAICDVIERKVKNGVEIKLIYDDAGSVFQLSDTTVHELQSAGVEIVKFNPVENGFNRFFFNHRTHQKIVDIDGRVAYTGGINASDRYANINSPFGHWKDVALKVRGEAVYSFSLIFLGMWEASGKEVDYERYKRRDTGSDAEKTGNKAVGDGLKLCHPFADGPSKNTVNNALDAYRLMVHEAGERVYITTPYLIVDDTLRDALILAAQSGVDVKIITPGIPDKKRVKLITEYHYGELIRHGVEIYEYTPGFIHQKVVFNEFSSLIGTINMDFRSFYLHYEMGVWSPDKELLQFLEKDFEETLSKCRKITYDEWVKRPIWDKLSQYVLYPFRCQF
ncbi:MAG: cardiolipin synthase [Lachnospiraceae bacterium]|nr:cardiolipin synthase [Lachnospiraceae bacterium]